MKKNAPPTPCYFAYPWGGADSSFACDVTAMMQPDPPPPPWGGPRIMIGHGPSVNLGNTQIGVFAQNEFAVTKYYNNNKSVHYMVLHWCQRILSPYMRVRVYIHYVFALYICIYIDIHISIHI